MNFFCIAGALNAGYVCDTFGRRRTFTISCAIFIVGILIQVRSRGTHEGVSREEMESSFLPSGLWEGDMNTINDTFK